MLIRTLMLTCLFCAFAGQSVLSQAPDEENFLECDQVLNSPKLKDLLIRGDGQLYGELSSDRLGAVLLGVRCSREQIAVYFGSAGWRLLSEREYSTPKESGSSHGYYMYDYALAFEKIRSFPAWLIRGQREAVARVRLLDGRVAYIHANFSK